MVADANGLYYEIKPVDQQSVGPKTLINEKNAVGKPSCYDKTGNAIFLDLIPDYNYTHGLKVFINREGSYFAVSDTTKKPGVAGLFHEYFVIVPAYKWVSAHAKTNADISKANRLAAEIQKLETKIITYYGRRGRDQRNILNSVGRMRVNYI